MDTISVKFNGKIAQRLAKIAAQTNKPETFHIYKAVEDYLEELEDIADANQVIKDIESGKLHPISLEELQKIYGLEPNEKDEI